MDNSDRFQALSKVFDNIEYPKDFKPMNIQKYGGKQDLAQWLHLYSTAVSVAGGTQHQGPLLPDGPGARTPHVARKLDV